MSDRELITSNLDKCWSSAINFFESLTEEHWQVQSLCSEWSIKDVASHLFSVEQALTDWIPTGLKVPPPFELVSGYFAAALQMETSTLVNEFRQTLNRRRDNLANMTDTEFSTPTMTPVGPGTYDRFMAVREFDFWMHTRDCAAPLNIATDNSGPTAEMALNEVRLSIGYIVGKKIGLKQNQTIHFNIYGAVERDIFVAFEDRAVEVPHIENPTVVLHCDSMAFMNQACGRVNPEIPIEQGLIHWVGDEILGNHAARNLKFTM
ncbi:MAG TPA: hypothetical protein DCP89_01635 [Acidimicrobiaceae bacterium]|jgi:uncharacterized protein (TIGR03083 family)|nr:hypothetical protein [Actinomycetota bacterium]HAN07177.1 hypothetical protein [Acidimicrobiaceae bacterium]|tara:strand:+ start:1187 stop:1975 length:789 start_codon:yes stop_codon:yes gene_type:complete